MTISPEQQKSIASMTKTIVEAMNLDCGIEVREEMAESKLAVVVSIQAADNAKFLIGKNGKNLQAVEQILRATFAKENTHNSPMIIVDVNDYRKARASRVIELAKQAVARVRNTQKAEALSPMSAYERRVVHMELASIPDVATESIGQEPQRRIIIKPL